MPLTLRQDKPMKAPLYLSVALLLLSLGHTQGVEEQLVVVRQDQKVSDAGALTDVLIESLAEPRDVEESEKWHPYSEVLLAPMKTIIEIAYENLKVPDGKLIYVKPKKYVNDPPFFDPFTASAPPDFRGADLRRLNENLWYWKVYFGVNPDRSIESQASIRDGELILSANVLPNGGKIVIKERKMTSQERIFYGLDLNPNVDPFAPYTSLHQVFGKTGSDYMVQFDTFIYRCNHSA